MTSKLGGGASAPTGHLQNPEVRVYQHGGEAQPRNVIVCNAKQPVRTPFGADRVAPSQHKCDCHDDYELPPSPEKLKTDGILRERLFKHSCKLREYRTLYTPKIVVGFLMAADVCRLENLCRRRLGESKQAIQERQFNSALLLVVR